jgi:hypothetical protein
LPPNGRQIIAFLCCEFASHSIGPFLASVPTIVAVRAPKVGTMLTAFFENDALVWITGGLLLFGGLLIIARHRIGRACRQF